MQESESNSTIPLTGGSNRSALVMVFLVVFIDLLGFGIVLPFLPRLGDDYLNGLIPGGKTAPWGGVILGLLMSSFSLMQFIFAPLWGRLSDRVGRRPILLMGLAGSVVFYSLLGFALELGVDRAAVALSIILLARLGAGIFGATIATAQAVIADSTPPEKRKHGMALIGAAFGIGFTFGPLLGFFGLAFFKEYRGAPGYLAALLSLVALVFGYAKLKETRRFEEQAVRRPAVNRLRALLEILHVPTVGLLVLMFFLATFGFGGFESTLALTNQDTLKLDQDDNFLTFAYVGFVLLLTQGFLYRRLAKRLPEEFFIQTGILLMGLGLVAMGGVVYWSEEFDLPWSGLLTWMLTAMTIAVVGFAFLTPSIQALISRRSDPARQGEILGVNQSASALARILGPFIGLTLYKLHPSHLLPYVFGAVLLLIMLPLLPKLRQP